MRRVERSLRVHRQALGIVGIRQRPVKPALLQSRQLDCSVEESSRLPGGDGRHRRAEAVGQM